MIKRVADGDLKASRRLHQQRQELDASRNHLEHLVELVEESPSVIMVMDHFGEIQYLNARAKQLIASLGLCPEDIVMLLPKPQMKLVESCIHKQDVLKNLSSEYSDYTLTWTIKPVRGKPLLQAHALVNWQGGNHMDVGSANDEAHVDPESPPHLYAISNHPDFRHQSGTVLVIDDDPMVHDQMSQFMTREGYKVHCADGGDAGLEQARKLKPDLITLDIMMPGKNGWIVLGALKDDPELAGIPVIIVSGVGNERFVHAMGADEYIPKPIDWEKLGSVMKKLSPRFRSAQAVQ